MTGLHQSKVDQDEESVHLFSLEDIDDNSDEDDDVQTKR